MQNSEQIKIPTGKASFLSTLLASAISGISALVLAAIFFGGIFQRLNSVEAKAEENKQKLEQQTKEINLRLDDIQKRMVEKDDFRDLRKDVQDFVRKK